MTTPTDQEQWADVPDDTLLEAATDYDARAVGQAVYTDSLEDIARRMRAEVERRTVALAERDGAGEALGRSANGAVELGEVPPPHSVPAPPSESEA